MGTPTFIKFSRMRGEPVATYERLIEEFIEPLGLERHEFTRLRRSDDPYDAGIAQHGDRIACESTDELLDLVRDNTMFGSAHLVPYVPGQIYFHVVDVDEEGFSLTAEIESSFVAWETPKYAMGQWFKMMITTLTAALQAEVCGYGRSNDYMVGYDSIDTAGLLERLRSGELLKLWYPIYHAISTDLIGVDEVRKIMEAREVTLATQDLQHEVSVLGYHLLYILP